MSNKINKFTDLVKMYEKDTTITRENINSKIYDAPMLHSKYHKYLYKWRRDYIKNETLLSEQFRKLWYYYSDEHERTLKSTEIKWHIETDDDYIKLHSKVKILKGEVAQIEDMVKFCSNISFFCQNIINWETFMQGE